ncbi:hypothetical protein JHW43_009508 [Diplocarpon mali]|nr:hypothetical protein JHW43_009508 [Diplocarpon mali]
MFSSMPYENPLGTSYNSTHSADSSFSDGSSAGWDSATVSSHVYTPASTPRRGSPRSVKREGPAYAAPTPASTPDRYGSINGFCAMNALTQDMMSAYPTSMIYEDSPPATTSSTHPHPHHNPVTMASLHHYGSYLDASMCSSFVPSHGLAMGTPALDHELYSPISDMGAPTPMPESCVAPSQTVQAPFMDSFGVQSPVKSLQFTINYDLPGPDYDPGLSIDSSAPPQSMRCVASEQYHNPTPPPTRRLEASTPPRNPHYQASPSESVASSPSPSPSSRPKAPQEKASRLVRKRAKRELRGEDFLPDGMTREQSATEVCNHPGCKGKFQRKEHLKRHINTVHKITKTVPCEFCGKEFGRNDNLKAHTLLHGQLSKNKRTLYYPGALQRWYEMSKKPRKVAGAKKIKEEGEPLVARSRALGY